MGNKDITICIFASLSETKLQICFCRFWLQTAVEFYMQMMKTDFEKSSVGNKDAKQ